MLIQVWAAGVENLCKSNFLCSQSPLLFIKANGDIYQRNFQDLVSKQLRPTHTELVVDIINQCLHDMSFLQLR